MSHNEQGTLYPFRLSASRMRQGAAQMRRQGQLLDSLILVRRAAEQEDTPAAWQSLAAEMRLTGNWEAAARLLAGVLARDPHQPGAWIDMAHSLYALDQKDLAVDCAYHQLQEDPWSPEGDAARALLAETDGAPEGKEPRRTQRLIHRGMTAWQSGERLQGERQIRRALQIAADKERLLVTTAMMCMLEGDVENALPCLSRALRYQPEDARTLTSLATLYHQLGKRRMARAFLRRAAGCTASPVAEDSFLTSAWAQDAWPETREYLDRRMKQHPYRIPLMSARATMLCETEQLTDARQLWRDILAVDPDDRQASTMLAWAQQQPDGFISMPGLLPRSERIRQQTELRLAAETLSMTELLTPGSRTRRLTDWMLESTDPAEMQLGMALLSRSTEQEAQIPYLKELLCRPFLRSEMRQWVLMRLAEMGCRDEMLMMTGTHYTLVQCQPVSEQKQRQPWRMFLPMLLTETRRYRQSAEIAEFAASIWRCMSPRQRTEAVGSGRYVWCKAMEILFLRMAGEEEKAVRAVLLSPLSARRISRVLRRLARCIGDEIVTE